MSATRLLALMFLIMFAASGAAFGASGFDAGSPYTPPQVQSGMSGGGKKPPAGNADVEETTEEESAEEEDSTEEEDDTETAEADDGPVNLTDLTEEQLSESVDFSIGNAFFIMFHEGGHMLVSELGLPVLGREEDAVDTLSALLLLEARDETLDKAISDSADGWFLSAENAGEDAELAFWDSHGLDEQRAYQIVCMMVGHDAKRFKEFADTIEFPQDRRDECEGEYQQARQSWFGLLSNHKRGEARQAKVKITYQPAGDADLQVYADMLKDAKLLETTADLFTDLYKLKDGIRFTAKACGHANAYWHPGEREITYCYEFTQFHMGLIAKWFVNNPDSE